MSELAARHNQGKPQLTYLLDMWEALADYYHFSTEIRGVGAAIRAFIRGGEPYLLINAVTAVGLDYKALGKVFEKGAEKYARGDWLKGRPYIDTLDSGVRHLLAYVIDNQELDAESGQPHLAHFAWNMLAVVQYDLLGLGNKLDDRSCTTEKAAAERPFKVGDRVKLVDTSGICGKKLKDVATIIEIDNSSAPYKIQFDDGDTFWSRAFRIAHAD